MKRFKLFLESISWDTHQRQEAESIFKQIRTSITDSLNNGQFEKYFKLIDGSYATDIRNVAQTDNKWILVLSPANNGNFAGGYGRTQTARTRVINLAVLLKPGDTKYLSTRLSGVENTFVHEYIHLLDSITSKDKGKHSGFPDKSDDQRKQYYNSYSEIHAWTQEILHRIDGYVSMLKKNNLQKKKEDIFGKTVGDFIQKMLYSSDSYKEMAKFLTPETSKKIKSKLGEYWLERIKPL